MKLKSKSIVLRHLEERDMLYIQKLWSDEETMLTSGGVFDLKDCDISKMFSILRKDDESINNHFIIETENKYVGDFNTRNYFSNDKKVQIDLKIEYVERNKGYGKEALILYLDYFFNEVRGEELFIELWLSNYFAKDKLIEYGFESKNVTDDIYHLTLTKDKYFNSILSK